MTKNKIKSKCDSYELYHISVFLQVFNTNAFLVLIILNLVYLTFKP